MSSEFDKVRQRRLPESFNAHGVVLKSPVQKNPKWVFHAGGSLDFSGSQITGSNGHPWPPPKGKSLKDIGGSFRTERKRASGFLGGYGHMEGTFGSTMFKYDGPILPYVPGIGTDAQFPKSVESSNSELDTFGAEAIDQCKPTNQVAHSMQFLTEAIHERLPSVPGIQLWKNRTNLLLGVANEFLNAEFGWLPMKKDIGEIATAISVASASIKQFRADSGKVVRRQFYFHTESDTKEEVVSKSNHAIYAGGSVNVSAFNSGNGVTMRRRKTTRRRWFSGAFTYHVPDSNDSLNRLIGTGTDADHLLGTALTPEVLWELTPWSWAIDWFSDAQEVISNFQDFELYGLIMRYGYMMETSIVEDTYIMVDGSGLKGVSFDQAGSCTFITEVKKRRPANPFGFGIEWADLSPTQLAIAAALGITRIL